MNIWPALIAGSVLTYLRAFLYFLFSIIDPPEMLRRALRFAPSRARLLFFRVLIRDGAQYCH
jgi:hypothetical protein